MIKRGQKWRRKKDGVEVVVNAAINIHSPNSTPFYDVHWQSTNCKPIRRGSCFENYFTRDYELIEDVL